MRSFVAGDGRQWQAALLDASYGNIALVFSPSGAGDVRRQALPVASMAEAMALLAGMDTEQLQALLAEAEAWDPGAQDG